MARGITPVSTRSCQCFHSRTTAYLIFLGPALFLLQRSGNRGFYCPKFPQIRRPASTSSFRPSCASSLTPSRNSARCCASRLSLTRVFAASYPCGKDEHLGGLGKHWLPRIRMSKAERRLAVAIRSAAGIEALVWLTDIAGLSRSLLKSCADRAMGTIEIGAGRSRHGSRQVESLPGLGALAFPWPTSD